MGMKYGEQLKEKQKKVEKLISPFCKVLPIIGMPSPVPLPGIAAIIWT